MENQASLSAKAQSGQHKDLYRGNIVAALLFLIDCGKDTEHEFLPLGVFRCII